MSVLSPILSKAGESADYKEVDYSNEHKLVPELIILLSATSNGGRTLLLLGPNSIAFSFMLLSPAWSDGGAPDSCEMLIQAEVNGDTILRVAPTAIRAIPASFWN